MNIDMQTKENKALLEEMFEVGAHFGYLRRRRHPSTKHAIFGAKNNVQIINLEKTADYLQTAMEFVSSLAKNGKQILFVGTKSEARDTVKEGASAIGMPYVTNRWIGGTLTNFGQIKGRIARLEDLMSKQEKGELSVYTKKERLMFDRERERLDGKFGGLISIKQPLGAMFVIDSKNEEIAVSEARMGKIPVISISNVDCDIRDIDYPIIANDSSLPSIKFFVGKIVDAYKGNVVVQKEESSEGKDD